MYSYTGASFSVKDLSRRFWRLILTSSLLVSYFISFEKNYTNDWVMVAFDFKKYYLNKILKIMKVNLVTDNIPGRCYCSDLAAREG